MLNKIKTTLLSIMLMMSSFIFAQEVVLGLGAVTDSSAEVTMDTPFDVGGFQFNAVGATLTGGSGGLAGDAGFTVSVGGDTVIGFSLTGSFIPAESSGVLTNLAGTMPADLCLSLGTGAISDVSGNALDYTFGESDCDYVEPCDEDADNDETIQYPLDEAGNTLIETGLINYLSAAGGTHKFRILGDHMANFDLIFYNETTGKYYNWAMDGGLGTFTNGHHVMNGNANAVALGHPDTFDVVFPTVSTATTYKVYFVESAPTIYKPFTTPTNLTAKWTINQLVNITTTVNWGSTISSLSTVTDGSNGSTVAYTFSTSAGANLSSNPNVSGEKTFTITFFVSGSKTIDWTLARKDAYGTGIHNDVVTVDDIDTPDTGDLSSILSINATASFVNNGEGAGCTGTITGSMTFGQMPLVNQSIIFNPDSFFTIA